MSLSDQALINQFIATKWQEPMGVLISRYQRQVRSSLYRLTRGDKALVDDLAQETFLLAYLKIKDFHNKGSFGGWLSKIAYNCFLSHLRKHKPYEILSEDMVEDSSTSKTENGLLKIDLERAMLRLNINERFAIDLCFANGYSHPEAAEIMDIPLGTLKSHVSRGKEKLKLYLRRGQS